MEIKNVSLDEENVLSTRIGEQIKNALGTRYSDLSKFTYKTWYWWWCYSLRLMHLVVVVVLFDVCCLLYVVQVDINFI